MAVLSGTIRDVSLCQTPLGIKTDNSSPKRRVATVLLTFTITGTYAQADNAQILLVPAGIESRLRNGWTVNTLLGACAAAPGDENGTPIGVGAVTVSTTSLAFPLTGGDLTTEHSNAALAAMTEPIGMWVTFTYSE